MKSWLIHESFIKETMLTQEETLVSCINDKSIVKFTRILEMLENFTDTLVNGSDRLHVISHETLVDIDIKSLTSEIFLVEDVRNWLIEIIPFLSLFLIHSS